MATAQQHDPGATTDDRERRFPIVGIGASAGGLEAFTELLQRLPENPGMAFVLIQHLDPRHTSLLPESLQRATSLPIDEIKDGMVVQPDRVYVIPPDADVGILHGVLTLLPRPPGKQPHMAIDFFFQALAKDHGSSAIGVVLSGTGTDGTAGLQAILGEDGITFAQDPATARFAGMPEAAIKAGVVDVVLPIAELVDELLRVARDPLLHTHREEVLSHPTDEEGLKKVLVLVRNIVGVDFSEYKATTIKRRLVRRMSLRRIASIEDYLRLLRAEPDEVRLLFDDVLIHVTAFFRDAGAFERLKTTVFPEIAQAKPNEMIRIWVTGCSTGEEVYTIAMMALEFLDARPGGPAGTRVQLFGTDVSEKAVEKARAGIYPDAIAADVSEERLRKYFSRVEGGYQITKPVRELCAFVRHDLARDPPFSKIDLISCRNTLIYFGHALQRRVLANFHFALNVPGFLLIGRTESLPDATALFTPLDKEHKIFTRTTSKSALRLAPAEAPITAAAPRAAAGKPENDVVRRFEALLLDRYAPAGVIVDERMEILHFRGRTGPYLEPAPGLPQHNLLHMLREGLLADVRIALAQARREATPIRKTGVHVHHDGSSIPCSILVVPLAAPPSARQHLFGVLFEEVPPPDRRVPAASPEPTAPADTNLAAELATTKEYLQSVIDDHQRANDELTSANEEMTSANEELQSLNEELETAKEELQSSNEELTTLNEELETRNAELATANGDLLNVLGSVEVPIVIVDGSRRIRRFTPKARPILNLLPADIGRPIGDIRPSIAIDLDAEIAQVIETVTMTETEVRDRDGRWYRLQIRPYTTIDKRIDGAVISIIDIDVLKQAVGAAEWARDYARATVEAVQLPLALLDEQARIVSVNEAYTSHLGGQPTELVGRSLYEIMKGRWDRPELRALITQVIERGERFRDHEIEITIADQRRVFALAAQRLPSRGNSPMLALLSLEDVSERRSDAQRLLAEATEAKARTEAASRAKDLFLATVSHELRTPLTPLLLSVDLLRIPDLDAAARARALDTIGRSARVQAQLIDDLLDISRIATGKLKIDLQEVSLVAITEAALDTIAPTAEVRRVTLAVEIAPALPPVKGDPMRLQQVVWNLLVNAIKFSAEGGRVTVIVDAADHHARIRVTDHGIGIAPEFLPHLFDPFSQADQTHTRRHSGLGLGLALTRYLVEAHGGTIEASSPGLNEGSTFTVRIPLWIGASPATPEPQGPPRTIRGARILVVDDDLQTRDTVARILAVAGAEVQTAASAAEALRLFEAFRPSTLVSDIGMPEEDGYSLLRRIRALGPERGGDVPALALTAFAADEDRDRATEAGYQQHVAKPIDAERLIQAVAAMAR